MTRLPPQLHRLYLPEKPQASSAALTPPAEPTVAALNLMDAEGRVRAMVIELARPADWAPLRAVWQSVQSDLALPAPAIAVSGSDGYQLWFSLAEAVPAAEAHRFTAWLRERHLSHIAAGRVALWPAADATDPQAVAGHASMLPPQEVSAGQWSAFVAPDLAPMFAETPWLDIPPSPEGQADLLLGLQSIKPADWHAALAHIEPKEAPQPVPPDSARQRAMATFPDDPKRFLLGVMNDDKVALHLRIEAAKALLPYRP